MDSLLDQLQALPDDWALVAVGANKRPYQPEWQKNPLTKDQVAAEITAGRAKAVGVLAGPQSGGLLFVDHDGASAAEVLDEIGATLASLPKSCATTSGRPGRFQIIYRVPQEFWEHLHTKKIKSGKTDQDGNIEQLELRWTGCQSVVIGAHPSTGSYRWLKGRAPGEQPIADAPTALIEQMLRTPQPTAPPQAPPPRPGASESERAVSFLEALDPARADDYDTWLQVGMALHSVGDDSLLSHWEHWSRNSSKNKPKDCEQKWRSFSAGAGGITLGTLGQLAKHDGWRPPERHPVAPPPPPPLPAPPPADPEPIKPAQGGYFTCLGFDGDTYFYLPRSTGQVVRLTRAAHTGTNLVAIAPLAYWESLYPGRKEGVNWVHAAASMFDQQAAVGVYDPDRVRGRGAWIDDSRVIFHLGDRLIVDGTPTSVLAPPPTRYFYEQARHLDGPGATPLPDDLAFRIRLIAERFRWEEPASAHFLLGWLVLAPVCGALNWRPHVWLTGGAGTGKTTILKAFLRPLLGGVVQSATGGTTEAGLRGTLKSDAIPIVFDEFEQNEQKDKVVVQNVLALARIASSEGGKIYKGTTSGGATSFEIRSMFCVSSINVSLIQKADIDRFCVLGLRKDQMEKGEWLEFEREIAAVASIDNGRALIARTLNNLPTITQNTRVLAQALGRRFGQRYGDQHGTLLAGAWSLEAGGGGLLDLAMADQWIDQMGWHDQQPDTGEADEIKCRDTILQQIVHFGVGCQASFGEMVSCIIREQSLNETLWSALPPVIGRYGMRVYRQGQGLPDGGTADRHYLAIANTNAQLDQTLRSTPWSGGAHRAALRRIPDAVIPNNAVHFAGVGTKRCVLVPIDPADLAEC